MKIRANKLNLKKYVKELLGVNYTEEKEKQLVDLCTKKTWRDYHDGCSHPSFAVRDYLEEINKVVGMFGVESLYPTVNLTYCNAGDTYATTIYFYKGQLFIGDWGSIAELYL